MNFLRRHGFLSIVIIIIIGFIGHILYNEYLIKMNSKEVIVYEHGHSADESIVYLKMPCYKHKKPNFDTCMFISGRVVGVGYDVFHYIKDYYIGEDKTKYFEVYFSNYLDLMIVKPMFKLDLLPEMKKEYLLTLKKGLTLDNEEMFKDTSIILLDDYLKSREEGGSRITI